MRRVKVGSAAEAARLATGQRVVGDTANSVFSLSSESEDSAVEGRPGR